MSLAESACRPAESPPVFQGAWLASGQKRRVAESYAVIAPAAPLLADVFYRRLFDIAPATRAMFPGDPAEQRDGFVTMLRLAVSGLDRIGDIVPMLKLMGARHRALGVEPLHYGLVGEALLWTLDRSLGERFTPDVRDAWVAVYTLMAEVMTADGPA